VLPAHSLPANVLEENLLSARSAMDVTPSTPSTSAASRSSPKMMAGPHQLVDAGANVPPGSTPTLRVVLTTVAEEEEPIPDRGAGSAKDLTDTPMAHAGSARRTAAWRRRREATAALPDRAQPSGKRTIPKPCASVGPTTLRRLAANCLPGSTRPATLAPG
jgi:hypothetical protein